MTNLVSSLRAATHRPGADSALLLIDIYQPWANFSLRVIRFANGFTRPHGELPCLGPSVWPKPTFFNPLFSKKFASAELLHQRRLGMEEGSVALQNKAKENRARHIYILSAEN